MACAAGDGGGALKYAPVARNGSAPLRAARQFMSEFVKNYNYHHRVGGIGFIPGGRPGSGASSLAGPKSNEV